VGLADRKERCRRNKVHGWNAGRKGRREGTRLSHEGEARCSEDPQQPLPVPGVSLET